MEYLYFKCDWLVQSTSTGKSFMGTYGMLAELECRLMMSKYKDWKVLPNGCHVIPFFLVVPSQQRFQECLEVLKDYIEFTNIQPASEKDAEGLLPFILTAGTTDIIYSIEQKAEHNARILKQTSPKP